MSATEELTEETERTLVEIGIRPEPELPTRIDQGDFDLLIPALRSVAELTQRCVEAEQQAADLQQQVVAARGAARYIFDFLKPKYGIKDGESIDSEGVITRV